MPSTGLVSADDGELDGGQQKKGLCLPLENVRDGVALSTQMKSPLGLKRRNVPRSFNTDPLQCTLDGRLLQGVQPASGSETSDFEAPANQDIDKQNIITEKTVEPLRNSSFHPSRII